MRLWGVTALVLCACTVPIYGDETQTLKDVESNAENIIDRLQDLKKNLNKTTSVAPSTSVTSTISTPIPSNATTSAAPHPKKSKVLEDSNNENTTPSTVQSTLPPSVKKLEGYVQAVEDLIASEMDGNVNTDDGTNMKIYLNNITETIKIITLQHYYSANTAELDSIITTMTNSKNSLSTLISEKSTKKLLLIVGASLGAGLLVAVILGVVCVCVYRNKANVLGKKLKKTEEAAKEDDAKPTQAQESAIMAGNSNPAFAEEQKLQPVNEDATTAFRDPPTKSNNPATIQLKSNEFTAVDYYGGRGTSIVEKRNANADTGTELIPRESYRHRANDRSPEGRAPRREYSPDVRTPKREYSPDVRASRREYTPEVPAPRREYSPEVAAPRREYSPEVAAPRREYSGYRSSDRGDRDSTRVKKATTHTDRYPGESKLSKRMHEGYPPPRSAVDQPMRSSRQAPHESREHQSRSAYYDREERTDSPPPKSSHHDKPSYQEKPSFQDKPSYQDAFSYEDKPKSLPPRVHQYDRFGQVQPTKHQVINPVKERREFRGPYGPDDIY